MANQKEKRVKTGIPGFDELVEGGLPRGSSILLSGSPSTGKTIFGLQFLYNGAKKYNEPGLYITCEDTEKKLVKAAARVGLKLKPMLESGRLAIKTFPVGGMFRRHLIKEIEKQREEGRIKRVVIDSLTTLNLRRSTEECQSDMRTFSEQEKVNRFMFDFLKDLEKMAGITKLLISEIEGDDERRLASDSASPFMCDGIIFVRYNSMGGKCARELVVRKMRFTRNKEAYHKLLMSDKGVAVRELGK